MAGLRLRSQNHWPSWQKCLGWCQEELPGASRTGSFLVPRGTGPVSLGLWEAGREIKGDTENISGAQAALAEPIGSAFGSFFGKLLEWGQGACTPSTTLGLKMPAYPAPSYPPSCRPGMLACLGSKMNHLALGNPEIANNCSPMKSNKAPIPPSPRPFQAGKEKS